MASARIQEAIKIIQLHVDKSTTLKKSDYDDLRKLKDVSDEKIATWFKRNKKIIDPLRNQGIDEAIASIESLEFKTPEPPQIEKEKKSAAVNPDILSTVTEEEIKAAENTITIPVQDNQHWRSVFISAIDNGNYPMMVALQRKGLPLIKEYMERARGTGKLSSALLLLQMNCPFDGTTLLEGLCPYGYEHQFFQPLMTILLQKGCKFPYTWFRRAFTGERFEALQYMSRDDFQLKKDSQNVFAWACLSGKIEHVQEVYKAYQQEAKELSPEERTTLENNTLLFAISFHQVEMIKELIKYGFKLPANSLEFANSLEMVQLLIKNNAPIPPRLVFNWLKQYAVSDELLDMIEFLKPHGLLLTELGEKGDRLFPWLFVSVHRNWAAGNPANAAILQRLKDFLINLGQVDVEDAAGQTALHYAAAAPTAKDVRYLLEHNATVKANKVGITPLMWAKTPEQVLLLEHDAKWDQVDAKGNTCLHHFTSPELLAMGLNAGLDINLRNKEGVSPWDCALVRGSLPAINFLIDQDGIIINARYRLLSNHNEASEKVFLLYMCRALKSHPEDIKSEQWEGDRTSSFGQIFNGTLSTEFEADLAYPAILAAAAPEDRDFILGILGKIYFARMLHEPDYSKLVLNAVQAVDYLMEMKTDQDLKHHTLMQLLLRIEDVFLADTLTPAEIKKRDALQTLKLYEEKRAALQKLGEDLKAPHDEKLKQQHEHLVQEFDSLVKKVLSLSDYFTIPKDVQEKELKDLLALEAKNQQQKLETLAPLNDLRARILEEMTEDANLYPAERLQCVRLLLPHQDMLPVAIAHLDKVLSDVTASKAVKDEAASLKNTFAQFNAAESIAGELGLFSSKEAKSDAVDPVRPPSPGRERKA